MTEIEETQYEYEYEIRYWESCLFRHKRRKEKLTFEAYLRDGIIIRRFEEDHIVAYYLYKENELIGYISGCTNENGFYVTISSLNPEYTRKGYGTILYEYVLHKYEKLISDIDRSPAAEGMWKRLERSYGPIVMDRLRRYTIAID